MPCLGALRGGSPPDALPLDGCFPRLDSIPFSSRFIKKGSLAASGLEAPSGLKGLIKLRPAHCPRFPPPLPQGIRAAPKSISAFPGAILGFSPFSPISGLTSKGAGEHYPCLRPWKSKPSRVGPEDTGALRHGAQSPPAQVVEMWPLTGDPPGGTPAPHKAQNKEAASHPNHTGKGHQDHAQGAPTSSRLQEQGRHSQCLCLPALQNPHVET